MSTDWSDLIQRHLSGLTTAEETRQLQDALKADDGLADLYLRHAELEVALEAEAASADATRELLWASMVPESERGGHRTSWRPLATAAAAALIIAAAVMAWTWFGLRESPVLTLVDASGSIAWSHRGEWRTEVLVGQRLAAGTIETVGESAMALLQFSDGTLVTLSGDSELSFSDDGQKLLVLRQGSIAAQVKPQPKDKPMLVRTPSAEAQVVGTVFNLAARTDNTLLKVDEGLVKLKRLADGSTVDVPAKSSAVASLDSGLKLNSTATPEPLTDWSFDFTTTVAPRDWRGVSDGTHMIASPYVASHKASGAIITHFGVSVRTAQLAPPISLIVTDASVIRYRLRQEQRKTLQIILLTSKPNGGYGGNFETRIDSSALKPNADGWCDVAVPIGAFKPLSPRHASPAGNTITSALLSSLQMDTKLAVARFELRSRP